MPVLSTISQDKDEYGFIRSEKFKTERGLELSIEHTPSGLCSIVPHGGGKPPVICDSQYTSYLKARKALIAYIEETDRLGFAEHPDKPVEKVRKPRTNGASEN